MQEKKYFNISELEKQTGLPRSTIHFYVREGVIHPPLKTGKTRAYYDRSHLDRLLEIKRLKESSRVPVSSLRGNFRPKEEGNASEKPVAHSGVDPRSSRRQEFINAAVKVFSHRGYHKTSVRDITEEVGVSAGTFYIYFPDKRALFIEAVDEALRRIQRETIAALQGEEDFTRRMLYRGRVFYENFSRYGEIFYQLRAETAGEESWPLEKIKKIYKELTDPVAEEIRQAANRGEIRNIDPHLLAYALTGLIEIMSARMIMFKDYDLDSIMAFLFDLLSRGIALQEPAGDTPR